MPLQPGTKLGQYEIRALIGVGGMGEVYRAFDTTLERDVALKLLPEVFARDSDRLARFKREAKLLASLNHPNIATIHGLEESNGSHFLVMEMVEGETLAELIRDSGLGTRDSVGGINPSRARQQADTSGVPLDEALEITKQICDALEHAHEKPVIHRDLKPANVKVTPEGKVKVLDFGLAKAFAGDGTASGAAIPVIDSNSPTLSRMPTGLPAAMPQADFSPTLPGVILGTAAYMSPEQARGKTVDKRTDIWALGCVLYELLTAKKAFAGEDVSEILASVLKSEPDWSALPAATLPGIRVLLRRSLEKDSRKRYRDAADVKIQIEETLSAPAAAPRAAVPTGLRSPVPRYLALLIAAVAAIAVGIGLRLQQSAAAPGTSAVAHVTISVPPGDRLAESTASNTGADLPLAFSQDGSHLAYVATRGSGVRQIFVRPMGDPEPKPLAGTEAATTPFFSPDGQWIGFIALGKLRKVSITGGAPQVLCDVGVSAGATWGPDNTIIFTQSASSGLMRVSADGGTPQILTTLDRSKGETSHRYPQVLPGGKAVLFTVGAGQGWDEFQVVAQVLATGERHVLVRGGHTGRYVPSGHLVYARGASLLAVSFDLARLEVKGNAPITVADGVSISNTVAGDYSISNTGSLAYISKAHQFEKRLVWVDRKGSITTLLLAPRAYDGFPVLSPDGRQAALSVISSTDDLWFYDLERGTLTKLTSEGTSQNPVWAPDGKRVAYRAYRRGYRIIFWRAADGTGAEEQLTNGENQQTPFSWSPDGKSLAFGDVGPSTGSDIWILPIEGRKPQAFQQTSADERNAQFSPDGRWLAYRSNESGRNEIHVQPFAGPSRKFQISTDGGDTMFWNPSGRELFYTNGDKMMAVEVTNSPTFTAGRPRQLFELPSLLIGSVSTDGQRFLATQPIEPEQPATQINVVLNWFEELKQKVPVKQ